MNVWASTDSKGRKQMWCGTRQPMETQGSYKERPGCELLAGADVCRTMTMFRDMERMSVRVVCIRLNGREHA